MVRPIGNRRRRRRFLKRPHVFRDRTNPWMNDDRIYGLLIDKVEDKLKLPKHNGEYGTRVRS